jgi:exodeoxyribonuclease VIII
MGLFDEIEAAETSDETGIFPSVPAEEYHKWPGASASRLKEFARSPAHALAAMKSSRQPTPEMIFGTAVHALVLEGYETFARQFVVSGLCCAKTGKGESCVNGGKMLVGGEWRCGVHSKGMTDDGDGRIFLTQDDADRAMRVRDSVMAHAAAKDIIAAATSMEVSARWNDSSGVRCKLRADMVSRPERMVADLKTAQDASPDGFMRAIASMRYHFQACHYMNGFAALAAPMERFVFIAVEKEEPFAVGVYSLRTEIIELVRPKLDEMLKRWKECEDSGVWPAYSQEIIEVGIPQWSARQLETI